MPEKKVIMKAITQWRRKVEWVIGLQDKEPEDPYHLPRFKSKKDTPRCPWACDALVNLTSKVTRLVYDEYKAASRKTFRGNISPLSTLAWRLLKSSPHVFIKTDKDGGYASASICAVRREQ